MSEGGEPKKEKNSHMKALEKDLGILADRIVRLNKQLVQNEELEEQLISKKDRIRDIQAFFATSDNRRIFNTPEHELTPAEITQKSAIRLEVERFYGLFDLSTCIFKDCALNHGLMKAFDIFFNSTNGKAFIIMGESAHLYESIEEYLEARKSHISKKLTSILIKDMQKFEEKSLKLRDSKNKKTSPTLIKNMQEYTERNLQLIGLKNLKIRKSSDNSNKSNLVSKID